MVMKLVFHISQRAFTPRGILQVLLKPTQCSADHIPMMELRAERALAQRQPQLVQTVQIFRPEPRRMRAQIDEERWPPRRDHLQRERRPWNRQALPRTSDTARQFL